MAKSPPKDSTRWTLMVKVTPAQGQPATYETEHDTEQEARSTFGATYKVLGTNHHHVEAWVDPPEGSGKRIKLLDSE